MENDETPRKKKQYEKRGPVFCENRKFQKRSEVKGGWRVQCSTTLGKQRCNGRGRYLTETRELIQEPNELHSSWCKPIKNAEENEELRVNYKRDVGQSIQTPRAVLGRHVSIFKEKTGEAPSLQYPALKNITSYAKKKVNPSQPKNLEEMGQFLRQEQYQAMLNYNWQGTSRLEVETVTADDAQRMTTSTSIVFADREWISHVLSFVEHTIQAFSDGTFLVTPAKLKTIQLFKLEVACFNRGIPVAYALMERRTSNDYESVIRCIVDKFAPQFLKFPVKIHLDFESGERQGWERVIPSAHFVPCLFHFDQIQSRNARSRGALKQQRRLKKPNLSEAEKVEKEKENRIINKVKRVLKFIMAMPMLPLQWKADRPLLKRIIDDLDTKSKKRMGPYLKYFRENWMSKKNPPEKWNVSNEPFKTNNFSETGNRLMIAFFPDPHPQPWTFVRALVLYHSQMAGEFKGIMGKSDLTKQKLIKDCTELLVDGKLGRLEFLENIADVACPHYEQRFDEEVESQSQEDEQQQTNRETQSEQEESEEEECLGEVNSEEEYLDEEYLEGEYLEEEYFDEECMPEEYDEQHQCIDGKQEEEQSSETSTVLNYEEMHEPPKKLRKSSRKQVIETLNREGGELEFEIM